ncbi:nucleoprotein TPR-like [Dorcoceras hygrometricum]|uniref:Nucleoprotein TPR-like n=1 Tax=Dorcoceras hygrometricum TaxID=472368 RepID=A0A2Z7A7E3_9LAMI|nr:nucleoprotein TPR-like [Dorcoceras hygrometricum]
MDENGVFRRKIDGLYPILYGVSCAVVALKFFPEPEICDAKWSEIRNRMLQCSAHLLGLLVWRVQKEESDNSVNIQLLHKLENAQKGIQELKKQRSEDAKANEKVMSIISSREQKWLDERKKLRHQVCALLNDLRVLENDKDKDISELKEKLKDNEVILLSKDKSLDEQQKKREEVEERLQKAEILVEELRENIKREAESHAGEIAKHKTAFIELVSNQRQLEAEMGRALKQVEAATEELDAVLEQKEQSVLMTQRLSMELVKMRKDSEQRDQILSAMLRKSKFDTAEKQMLLKEVKESKAKRKQAELETERLRAVSVSKNERNSFRNMLSKQLSSKSHAFAGRAMMSLDAGNFRMMKKDYHLKYEKPVIRKELEVFSLVSDPYSTEGTEETQSTSDVEHLENWVNSEAEKYKFAIEQRHYLELEAFAEQLRLKDEKLEAFRWRMMSMELESNRLQSHIEGLDHNLIQLKQEEMKLKATLLDREAEIHKLTDQVQSQFNPSNLHKLNVNPSLHNAVVVHDPVWSNVKVIKRKPGQRKPEMKAIAEDISQEMENDMAAQIPSNESHKDIVLTLQSGTSIFQQESIESEDVASSETSTSVSQELSNKSSWKMDIHALGVLYKIKRLKQQLLMLERLTGKQESNENGGNKNGICGLKGFYPLISLLNKQVDRYQSLQTKNNDLCKRMHETNLNLNSGSSNIAKTEDETKTLEQFLEETFQLQRYIVATGQKLMEVQAKIASGFVCDTEDIETPATFDMKRFADSIRTLFQEVQRGLEVRISRIIGDLEGTLACNGIIHLKK